MNSIESVRMAQRCIAAEESFQKATQIMSTEVSIPTSGRYNSKYDEDDLHRSLIALSVNNSYAESGMERLAVEASSEEVPSGSWVRDAVEKVPEKEMKRMLERALASTLDQVKSFKLFNAPVICAADLHDIPRYDRDSDKGYLRRSKKERGTNTFEGYATLQCVEEGMRAQLSCEHVGLFDEKASVVERLLVNARMEGIDISFLLLDRGFFGSSTINMLKKLHQRFLMPCILTPGMKKALQEYARGERGMISDYTLKPSEGEGASFTLVIFPRARCDEKETDPCKKYVPFATNIPRGEVLWNVSRLPKDYRARWGIESGYVGVEEFRARTTSRNHSLRLLYFYYALILYNAWLIANLTLARRFCMLPLREPVVSVELIKGVFDRLIAESFRG